MAQIQKPNVRAAIIAAAKQEFIKNGIEAASMRVIAKNANITVGNIYRYFTNKEALADEIMMPTLARLNEVLSLVEEPIGDDYDLEKAISFIDRKVKQLSEGILTVFKHHKEESLIVLNYPRFYDQVVASLYHVIQQFIDQLDIIDAHILYTEEISKMLSEAIMSGLAKGLTETLVPYHDQLDELKAIVNLYLTLFVTMLRVGFNHE
ncbi:MAG: TetR/AcrR family transcriptional regulator [Erysipelothrix sp.]|jgi:AcrR family transcriptional regulator|nr:TetR/AcrR family transcriptional regulator [Erysipelothrix sp.]